MVLNNIDIYKIYLYRKDRVTKKYSWKQLTVLTGYHSEITVR